MTQEEVTKLLAQYKGSFNCIFDCWSAGNGHEFMALLVSFILDGKVFIVVLNLIEMNQSHTGCCLAKKAFQYLKEFGIADCTLGHTGDNTSNKHAGPYKYQT